MRQGMDAQLDVFLPLPLTRRGPSYTCGMLARGMVGPGLDVTIVAPRARSYPVSPHGTGTWEFSHRASMRFRGPEGGEGLPPDWSCQTY